MELRGNIVSPHHRNCEMRYTRGKRQARKRRLNRRQRRNLKRFQNSSSPRPLVSQEEAILDPPIEQRDRLLAKKSFFYDWSDAKFPPPDLALIPNIWRELKEEAEGWKVAKAERSG